MDNPPRKPLTPAAILCGIEHGGTTLLLDMLKAHPRVYARFEVGLLLAESLSLESIKACRPYVDMLCACHGLRLEELREMGNSPDWITAYAKLLRLCLSKERDPADKSRDFFIDKTPAYSRVIGQVMRRVPGVPVVAMVRDPRGVYASWKKRALIRHNSLPPDFLSEFLHRYANYMTPVALAAAAELRVLLVRYEDVATAPEKWVPVVCRHIGLDFMPDMIDPGNSFAPQPNSYGKLHPAKIAEFKSIITPEEEEAILQGVETLAWTVYPVEQRIQETGMKAFSQTLPALPEALVRSLTERGRADAPSAASVRAAFRRLDQPQRYAPAPTRRWVTSLRRRLRVITPIRWWKNRFKRQRDAEAVALEIRKSTSRVMPTVKKGCHP